MSERSARNKYVKIRTTSDERDVWQALADEEGVSLADLIRKRLNDSALKSPKSKSVQRVVLEADPKVIRELSRIGSNMNQIARAVNAAGLQPEDVITVLGFLSDVAADLTVIREEVLTQAQAHDLSSQGVDFVSR
ncbi:hypothetical protein CFI10_13520 [Marinobacterium iners]|uniref:MobC family plasmid mobilization relaxosome protein n=1 Tax=Marinobacterium iners TaxID=48076 RepID=UPI001A8FF10F|nr:MobC family plasmid mobilization relaxosome protein [Marinobacterium iners]QSR36000.1 hypothetical protein CFI10_13520 [Marinobacterium iners]